eukprot:757434_1
MSKCAENNGYRVVRVLGAGSFGTVFSCIKDTDGGPKNYACKVMFQPANTDTRTAIREKKAMMRLLQEPHPNLIAPIEVIQSTVSILMVFELAQGDLIQWLNMMIKTTPAVEFHVYLNAVQRITKGILNGVDHLHKIGLIHRDLKPDNILLKGTTIKISDFGTVSDVGGNQSVQTFTRVGTVKYMAPEIGTGKYGKPVDVWSIGCIMNLFWFHSVPFKNQREARTKQFKIPRKLHKNKGVHRIIVDFIRAMLFKQPAKRWTIDKLQNHPFFNLKRK